MLIAFLFTPLGLSSRWAKNNPLNR